MSDSTSSTTCFIGVDVQIRRGIPVAVMDAAGVVTESAWHDPDEAAAALAATIVRRGAHRCHVGIDAPRMPLPAPRTWSCRGGRWRDGGEWIGRHCEVAIRALGLGNPQWTPMRAQAPAWMLLGFELFAAAEATGAVVHEVFPTVTYRQLDGLNAAPPVTMPLSGMRPGPKDMLDAVAAAYTVWRFASGAGVALGGGDGLGTIVVPGEVEEHPVREWPQ